MKKKLAILILSLVLCTTSVCIAAAANYTKGATVTQGKTYTFLVNGSNSVFSAEGGSTYCFSTIRNTSSTPIYAMVSVYGINTNDGTSTEIKTGTSTYLTQNIVVTTGGLERDKDIAMKYFHFGKTCKYTNTTSVYDTFDYVVTEQ